MARTLTPQPARMTAVPDKGCDLHRSCFTCPEPDCKDTKTGERWQKHQAQRTEAILAYIQAHPGATDAAIAAACRVRARSVKQAKDSVREA